MANNFIKGLTLTVFFGLIGGFVAFRMGVFEPSSAQSGSMQISHNGGNLLAYEQTDQVDSTKQNQNANQQQNENANPAQNQTIEPVFERDIMPSSKSMSMPINFGPIERLPHLEELKYKELTVKSPSIKGPAVIADSNKMIEEVTPAVEEEVEQDEKPEEKPKEESSTPWMLIGLGALGVAFLGIGVGVYLKKRSA